MRFEGRFRRVGASAPAKRRSDLATRAAAGIAMIAVALAALTAGGAAFWVLVSAAALLMLAEWAGLMRATPPRIASALLLLAVPLALACPVLVGPTRDVVMALGGAALVVMVAGGSVRLGLGLLYAGAPALALLFLRGLPHGLAITLWTLATVWATDIGAYFAGRAIGGARLAPMLSPNKTWAGLGGGMAAAAATGSAIALMFALPEALRWAGGATAVLAQAGDLFESWLKRRAGVKDSGRLLPGHGGALDRLDGVVPVATLMGLLASGGWL